MLSVSNPKTKRLSWDETFMNLASIVAKRAACKFHEAGVVLVDENKRIVSVGYNGPTEGDYHCLEFGCAKVDGDPETKKLKRCRGAHAEINGIINAQDTTRLRGATAYSLLFPCYDCMKAFNNAGIKEIVYANEYKRIQTGGEKHEEEREAWELAEKRGIKIRKYEGKLLGDELLVEDKKNETIKNKDDEMILVVPRDLLFEKEIWWGLKKDNLNYYLDLIKTNAIFKRRGDMENNPAFKQIIPYMLFSYENKFFAYKYLANAGEQRLVNNNYQLGVGGHMNKEDINGTADILETGMMREWDEEVDFKGNFLQKNFVGIINDDSKPVEQVHLGLVYHFIGDSPDIHVKETDKMEGKLLEMKDLSADKIDHSVWMQIVYKDYLSKL